MLELSPRIFSKALLKLALFFVVGPTKQYVSSIEILCFLAINVLTPQLAIFITISTQWI